MSLDRMRNYTEDELCRGLLNRLETIEIPEPAMSEDDSSGIIIATQALKANILGAFSAFLAAHADLVPSKDVILKVLDKAIDVAFDKLNRPFVANLLKPIVKQQILAAAGALYDSIFHPSTEVVA